MSEFILSPSLSDLSQTIEWGKNDIIATSVKNKIITGSGFTEKYTSTETVTEYEGDFGTAVAWSGNGVNLAVGTDAGLVQIWNLTKKKVIVEEKCCEEKCTVTSLQWHPMHHSLVWSVSGVRCHFKCPSKSSPSGNATVLLAGPAPEGRFPDGTFGRTSQQKLNSHTTDASAIWNTRQRLTTCVRVVRTGTWESGEETAAILTWK